MVSGKLQRSDANSIADAALAQFFLTSQNKHHVQKLLEKTLQLALDFKTRERVSHYRPIDELMEEYCVELPKHGTDTNELADLIAQLLDSSINWSSPRFMGFNDAGNSISGLMGAVIEATCQQNLINSDFCARSATFIEICTVRWLRELVGYVNPTGITGVHGIGGVATTGGTSSNMYGLLMARKNAYPDSFARGIPRDARPKVLVAGDITHYSVGAAAGLIGFGTEAIVKVPTTDFAMSPSALREAIRACQGRGEDVVCVVFNVGDSRTLTIDDLPGLLEVTKELVPNCWVHADACNGGQLLFSKRYRHRLAGIDRVDSIALDPHKVFNVPYVLSYFLFKEPAAAQGFWSSSSLIMRDPWALGQLTPNIGSKTWSSLKLFLLLKHLGTEKLAEIVDCRIELARNLRSRLNADRRFRLLTVTSDVNSVPFIYVGAGGPAAPSPSHLYRLNEDIYNRMLREGTWYLHGFPISDDGNCLEQGREQKLFVLRFMTSHPCVGESELEGLVDYLGAIGDAALQSLGRDREGDPK